ncbi:tumor necrosis factor receptor superfamily member 13B [Sparus aurata]|uniref:tumor necrosis factor receptor superfamily member 13B n=1 Tax=Sparus aurata TaxID=8175 RepID=UPI0011C17B0C|nr:tumor necrosis factor receptor superfamily member 13B [Sparus aurata]
MLKRGPVSLSSSNHGFSHCVFISPERGLSGPMADRCHTAQYWDALISRCMDCDIECQRPHVIPRCASYCEPANCKAQAGHYYDGLLKRCVRCAEVCDGPPAECTQHCQTSPPPIKKLLTTNRLLVGVTSHVPYSRVPTALEDPTILLYTLLSLCTVLLFSSLSLALVVFLRGARAKSSNPATKENKRNQECVVQLGQEVGPPGPQPGQSSDDFVTNSSLPTDREPSNDSSPTETCVCVHCFPDLKVLGQGHDRPPRAPLSLYPQAVLHRAQIQNGEPLWTEGNLYTSGPEVQEEAAVG